MLMKTIYYQINFSRCGKRIEVEFPASDVNHHEKRRRNAISLAEARMIAGDSGFVYKKITTYQIVEEASRMLHGDDATITEVTPKKDAYKDQRQHLGLK